MTTLRTFGDPERFAITLDWAEDRDDRGEMPAHGGWSMGMLRLTIGGYVLTRHERAAVTHDQITWYLLPLFEWLAENWISLLHEERFAWRENSAAPSATAAFFALRHLIDAQDADGRSEYRARRAWWMRHALRAADSSALYPDLFWRRLGDDVELSWTARQPVYAPDGFRFTLEPGAATLPVDDVAGPLWTALTWFADTAPVTRPEDRAALDRLRSRLAALSLLSNGALEAAYLPEPLIRRIAASRARTGIPDRGRRSAEVPAMTRLDDPVLMFGGVSPEIDDADLETLLGFMAEHDGGRDGPSLAAQVDTSVRSPLGAPHEEGYDFAEQLIDDHHLADNATSVNIAALMSDWGVAVSNRDLRTGSIRGVALAGDGYAPAILVNGTSLYNRTEVGRRFTLAHELFHVLYDRTRARRVAHTSGPWAPAGIEKRANAFAAMLLMPRSLIRRSFSTGTFDRPSIAKAAKSMKVGASALVEHLYNIGMIDAATRDGFRLRGAAVAY